MTVRSLPVSSHFRRPILLAGLSTFRAMVVCCLMIVGGCASERCIDSQNDEIALHIIQGEIAERAAELGFRIYITISGKDPSATLLADVRELGVNAKNGSEITPNAVMHFTYEVVEMLEQCDRRVEYAFRCNGMCGSGGTAIIRKTSDGWEIAEGRFWVN